MYYCSIFDGSTINTPMKQKAHFTLSLAPLLSWFSENKRTFPWRTDVSAYAVLVSEIMLQQTQAARVVAFFSRWMMLFPTLQALASASEEAVLKAWEGLGYYSRARALHRTARLIISEHGGKIPSDEQALLALPGIGPYTAGAIRAFAFHERAAAVDANVSRVVFRLAPSVSRQEMAAVVEGLLPKKKPWKAMEALIELGALVCKPKPVCSLCPLAGQCYALATSTTERLLPKTTVQRTSLWRDVAIFLSRGAVLTIRNGGRRVMSGLYEFPYFESPPQGRGATQLIDMIQPLVPPGLTFITSLPEVSHSFTRFCATLYPTVFSCDQPFAWPCGQWVTMGAVTALPFSAGHRRILDALLAEQLVP